MYALLIKPHSNVPACIWLSLKIYLGSVPDEDTEQLRPACLYTSFGQKDSPEEGGGSEGRCSTLLQRPRWEMG